MSSANLESMFNELGLLLPSNIKHGIEFSLQGNDHISKHFAFIVDMKTRGVLAYDSNIYFITDTFPFSIHAEVQAITKYRRSKSATNNKKILIVTKLSKTGIAGSSRCCKDCVRFINLHMMNLNIRRVYYTDRHSQFVELRKEDLASGEFRYSKGYLCRR